jgi:hypothetical protein
MRLLCSQRGWFAGNRLRIVALLILTTIQAFAADTRRVLLLHAFGHPYSPWIAGGLILAVIFVTGTITASTSRLHRGISVALAILALGLQAAWLSTHETTVEFIFVAAFAAFCRYTALVILRHVLTPGPVFADAVHGALSVYILLALFGAGAYALVEIASPGGFSFPATSANVTAHL